MVPMSRDFIRNFWSRLDHECKNEGGHNLFPSPKKHPAAERRFTALPHLAKFRQTCEFTNPLATFKKLLATVSLATFLRKVGFVT